MSGLLTRARARREDMLDKYADLATDLADGATQINFHDFHGEDVREVVRFNIRRAMEQLLRDWDLGGGSK
jgi:hypothetical protein